MPNKIISIKNFSQVEKVCWYYPGMCNVKLFLEKKENFLNFSFYKGSSWKQLD